MKLTLTEFLSLDGVSQGPGSPEEDTSDGFTQGGWLVPHIDEAFIQQTATWLGEADALLLGRRTYDSFARDWPKITDPEDPFTEKMNGLPKYVASHRLAKADWAPTTILSGDILAQVADLKSQPGRELQIHGWASKVRNVRGRIDPASSRRSSQMTGVILVYSCRETGFAAESDRFRSRRAASSGDTRFAKGEQTPSGSLDGQETALDELRLGFGRA